MDEHGHLWKLRWCDNRSGTYEFRITESSQLQNEYAKEFFKKNINKIKLKSRFNV